MKSFSNILIRLLQGIFWLLVMGLAIIYFGYLGLDMMKIRDIQDTKLDRFGLNLMNVREMRSTRLNMGEMLTETTQQTFDYLQMISDGELGTVILVAPITSAFPVFTLLLDLLVFRSETISWRTVLTIGLIVPGVILVILG